MVVRLLFLSVCVSACETERIHLHSAARGSDATTRGSDATTRGSDATVKESPESSPTSAPVPTTKREASAHGETGAGPRPNGDANCVDRSVPDVDPGDPPPECMRKCLWDLLKRCSPLGCCNETRIDANTSISCAPDNDWWRVTAFYDRLTEVHAGGSLCYRSFLQVASSTFYGDFTHWFDGQGNFVAGESMPLRGGDLLGYCPGEDPVTGTVMEYGAPHCSPWLRWRYPACTSGVCSGTPPPPPTL
jgi:hypothetical protein